MLAYNSQWLNNNQIQEQTKNWFKRNLISQEQSLLIQQHYPAGFYTPNAFIRIGLGFFAAILLGAAQSFFWAVVGLASGGDGMFGVMGFLYLLQSVGCFFILESFIKSRHHYASGIDDILLYTTVGEMIAGMCLLAPEMDDPIPYLCIGLPFLVIGAVRYIDRILTVLVYGCLLTIVLLIVNKIPGMALYLLPFTGIGFSLAAYFLVKKYQKLYSLRYWLGNFQIIEILSLITFYLSGNFLFIQESAEELFGLPVVPMGWFFWTFTLSVPLGYMYLGLKNKDRGMLWIGLGCVAFAVFTFRTYFHVMPLPYAASLAGGFLFVLAYVAIQYLKKGIPGFTYEPEDTNKPVFLEAEALVVAQTLGHSQTPEKDFSFGGGQVGGGGAGGDF
ncbi:hypothetical protein [Xanthocytophaga agilis]|uniref:Uncharacterized protein n=1 Tax=Xanthocytophaga agilis TaxID=3048010 RepID=A0AAE3QXU4_9BACT|nr:hypothetical protein [Xanthocytophaga agilis]MDJ1500066.1 hypothetical protein [Xanthocytophaga agilis]